MRDLTEAGRAVVDNPPAAPTPIEQITAKAHRRRRRRMQQGTAIAAAAALLTGALVAAVDRHASTSVAVKPAKSSTARPASIAPAPGYRIVSYHGVHVEVPDSWPVVDGMHTGFCTGPFPNQPTAFVGPQENGSPSCPYVPPRHPGPDGVWLQSGTAPADATPVTTASGQTLLKEKTTPGDTVEQLWYHQTFIQIGIGADPTIAKRIFQSIGFTAAIPDTAAEGVCARQDHPDVMPTPERLSKSLVVDNGNDTLNPPAPSDRAVISAAHVWNAYGPKRTFERYRIILARYSARLPARQNPDGSLTPLDHDELAWVIYSMPVSPTINGCGLWGLDVTNAITGNGIVSSGYSPGP